MGVIFKDFFKQVSEMRRHQKEFFKAKDPVSKESWLRQAKESEGKVDRFIVEMEKKPYVVKEVNDVI